MGSKSLYVFQNIMGGAMTCCDDLQRLLDLDLVRYGPPHKLPNGRILTEIDTEYFFAFGEERPSYVGIHYCPFCGRVLSRELWNREKKKG
jgi:hypothetical protein